MDILLSVFVIPLFHKLNDLFLYWWRSIAWYLVFVQNTSFIHVSARYFVKRNTTKLHVEEYIFSENENRAEITREWPKMQNRNHEALNAILIEKWNALRNRLGNTHRRICSDFIPISTF